MGLNPLEQLNPVTMAAMAVIFLATFVILRKVFFTPLIDAMEKRAGKLERAQARYREAGALVEKAREEAAGIAAEAAEAAKHLHANVKEELARIGDAKRAQASAEAETVLARGRDEVARLREAEQARLKEQLLTCSRQTLVKMIPEVDEERLRFMVSRVLAARGTVTKP
jgi:F0F1-type ATP synthase membrane subunit b/b'